MELVAVLIAAVALVQVFYQFIVGKHFIIPTAILFIRILFGNLARYGMQGALWAKRMLFWFGLLVSCYLFFALFHAQTFPQMMGSAFLPVFIVLFVVFSTLTALYKSSNALSL